MSLLAFGMLVLQAMVLEPMHGWGIAERIGLEPVESRRAGKCVAVELRSS